MLKKITFREDHRCFKQGETFDFRPGVNLLVGDQGSGKSTILECMNNRKGNRKVLEIEADQMELLSFDFEMDNIRKRGSFYDDNDGMRFQLASKFSSHGQSNLAMLRKLESISSTLFCMDEPDMALSIRSCFKLAEMMKKSVENDNQIIASIHNPIVIREFDQVLSLEHKCWMNSEDFIESQIDSIVVS